MSIKFCKCCTSTTNLRLRNLCRILICKHVQFHQWSESGIALSVVGIRNENDIYKQVTHNLFRLPNVFEGDITLMKIMFCKLLSFSSRNSTCLLWIIKLRNDNFSQSFLMGKIMRLHDSNHNLSLILHCNLNKETFPEGLSNNGRLSGREVRGLCKSTVSRK